MKISKKTAFAFIAIALILLGGMYVPVKTYAQDCWLEGYAFNNCTVKVFLLRGTIAFVDPTQTEYPETVTQLKWSEAEQSWSIYK